MNGLEVNRGLATRYVCELGEDVLRKKAKEVKKIDRKIIELLDDMANTLYEKDGIGLAAPQVGILKRVVVIDIGEGLIELINPVITRQEGEQIYMEGCLSYPGHFGNVKRPAKLTLRAFNREGQELEYEAEGLLAVVFCHELDHLEGTMFIDRVIGEIYTAEQLKAMSDAEEGEATLEEVTSDKVTSGEVTSDKVTSGVADEGEVASGEADEGKAASGEATSGEVGAGGTGANGAIAKEVGGGRAI